MKKKKVIIILSSLFFLLFILFFLIFAFANRSNTVDEEHKDKNVINTSSLKSETNYASDDTTSEYNKMLEEAKIEEQLLKEKKEKEKAEKLAKEESSSTKSSSTKSSNTKSSNTKSSTEDGVAYVTSNEYIKIPEGVVGSGDNESLPIKSDTKKKNNYDDLEPIYSKYTEKVSKDIANKKTKETKILNKYFKNQSISNLDTEYKEDTYTVVELKQKNGTVGDTLISVLNLTGTRKHEGVQNMTYNIYVNVDYIDKYIDETYKVAKDLGIPLKEKEFKAMYKRYKENKRTKKDIQMIGNNGTEVVIVW